MMVGKWQIAGVVVFGVAVLTLLLAAAYTTGSLRGHTQCVRDDMAFTLEVPRK